MPRRHRTARQEAEDSAAGRKREVRRTAAPSAAVIRRARASVARALRALPEAALVPVGEHAGLEVRGKRFGWLLVDHHGDGRVAVNLKCSAILSGALKDALPAQFHVPQYVGHRGWIGLWLDREPVSSRLLANAVAEGWRLAAPKRLLVPK